MMPRASTRQENAMPELTATDTRLLRDLAVTYRRLVILVGLQLLVGALSNGLLAGAETATERIVLSLVVLLAALGLAVVQAFHGYWVAQLLGASAPAVWAVGMFVPVLNIAVLLSLSGKAQAACKRHGVRVGFLGPHKLDIANLERRIQSGKAPSA